MMIINGEELIKNPAKIILEAQDFMNLDPIIKEENFIFDKEKGTVSKKNSIIYMLKLRVVYIVRR